MGWMSWQQFRCATNCTLAPTACIDESLYRDIADAMVDGGYTAAGYASVHLDDCILDAAGRDPGTGRLRPDPARFPSGFAALGDYLHARNMTFAFYTAESSSTCGGWPGSAGHEILDADTFASWGAWGRPGPARACRGRNWGGAVVGRRAPSSVPSALPPSPGPPPAGC